MVVARTENEPRISSLEIAELTGKQHKNLLQSIKKQEVAWKKINGLKFKLVKYKDGKGEMRPMYELTKLESLYIISKYNDEVRARLVRRWYDLENNKTVYLVPRKTKEGVPRLPYSKEERELIRFINSNLVEGDYSKIRKQTNYSKANISLVLNGKHINSRILKEAYRVATSNVIQGKNNPQSNYDIGFVSDAIQTINKLKKQLLKLA